MKVKSVAWLASIGMLLSSVTVWSLTEPKVEPEPVAFTPDRPALAQPVARTDFAGASFASGTTLRMEGRLGHSKLDGDKDNDTLVLVDVRADGLPNSAAPTPLNLAIVIDRSGSMKGKRLQNALDGARGMVRRLRDGDVVSVVTYNQTAETVVPPTTVDAYGRDRVLSALSAVTAQGDTCISCGIDEGMARLRQRSGMVDRILLLSDGEATAGVRDPEGFRSIGARIRTMGASISSVGVDVDYNERVMNTLALESNGRHYFVENAGDLPRVFDQELDTLVKSVAKNAEIALELGAGVELERVFDRTFRRDGRRLIVPMGSFSAGEEKTLLLSIRVARGAPGERPITDVRMSFEDLAHGGTLGVRGDAIGKLSALLVSDGSQTLELDPQVSARLLRSQTSAALNEANDLFQNGRSEEARRRLAERLDSLKKQRADTLARAPSPVRAKVAADLDRQSSALGRANDAFEPSPATASSPEQTRKGKAQVRKNSVEALDMAF